MKELDTFRKFLAEGQIDENLSQNLIKVYEDEIESLMASGEDDVVPALRMGIASLQRGEDPSKVNMATAKKVAQIQGEFDFDEFARIYMDGAQRMNENQMKNLAKLLRDEADQPDNKVGKDIMLKYATQAGKTDVKDIKSLLGKLEKELIAKHPDTFSGEDDIVGSFLSVSKNYK